MPTEVTEVTEQDQHGDAETRSNSKLLEFRVLRGSVVNARSVSSVSSYCDNPKQ
jgi:hypothetical protein